MCQGLAAGEHGWSAGMRRGRRRPEELGSGEIRNIFKQRVMWILGNAHSCRMEKGLKGLRSLEITEAAECQTGHRGLG